VFREQKDIARVMTGTVVEGSTVPDVEPQAIIFLHGHGLEPGATLTRPERLPSSNLISCQNPCARHDGPSRTIRMEHADTKEKTIPEGAVYNSLFDAHGQTPRIIRKDVVVVANQQNKAKMAETEGQATQRRRGQRTSTPLLWLFNCWADDFHLKYH